MTEREFINWYRSIRNPVYVSGLKLAEIYEEIYESGYMTGLATTRLPGENLG